jgi:hypothetical protein
MREDTCEVLTSCWGVPVIGLRYSALGEARSVKSRFGARPICLHSGDSGTAARRSGRPGAISSVHERTRLEIAAVTLECVSWFAKRKRSSESSRSRRSADTSIDPE